MTLSSIILHQFEDTNVSLPGFLVQHLIQSQLNYRPLTIKVNIIYKYQILQDPLFQTNISSNKKKMAPNLHPNLIIDLRAQQPRQASASSSNNISSTISSRSKASGSGRCPDDVHWDPDPTQKTDGSPTEKKTYGCFFVPNVEEKKTKKKTETTIKNG